MSKKKSPQLKNMLSDYFAGTWKLLSETSRFLSRAPVFSLYEEELRVWRLDLQSAGAEEQKRIRQEIIELRASLRKQGFDLTLAGQNLVVDGFRNDAAMRDGFRRVVIFFADDDLFWLSGDANHITLAEMLDSKMDSRIQRRDFAIRSKHYLWYRRRGNDLILSGSDTETKDDFERFKAIVEANSLKILAKLKDLK